MASLVQRLNGLATAVGTHIRDSVKPRLLPVGGTTGQVLIKTATTDFVTAWQTPSGGGGSQQVFVQQTRPAGNGPWEWWQTDATGRPIKLIIANGAP